MVKNGRGGCSFSEARSNSAFVVPQVWALHLALCPRAILLVLQWSIFSFDISHLRIVCLSWIKNDHNFLSTPIEKQSFGKIHYRDKFDVWIVEMIFCLPASDFCNEKRACMANYLNTWFLLCGLFCELKLKCGNKLFTSVF